MKDTKPKVELSLNESVQLTLLKDKALVGENSYGPYFMYSVQNHGSEKVFFATAEVHKQILEAGLKSGDSFELRKVSMQDGKKLSSKLEFAVLEKRNGNGHNSDTVMHEQDGYRDLMQRCLQESLAIVRSVEGFGFTNEDVRSICNCLFIQRSRN